MVAFQRFDTFSQDLGRKVHNLHADTLKVLLTNTAPVLANAVKADLVEIAAGNGYAAGGATVTGQSFTQVAGVASLVGADTVITAAGGAIGPFRYAVLYNDTSTSDSLIGWWDAGLAITLSDTQVFTVDVGAATLTVG